MNQPATPLQPSELYCTTTNLSYLEAGAGEPTSVLLHGFGASKEIWWATLAELAALGRVLAPDLPGHGGSPLLQSARMPQIARRILDFCDARSLTRIVLVGHSMGGNIAVELVLARPALVERLVLVDPAAHSTEMPIYSGSARVKATQRWAALRAGMALAQKVGVVGRYVPHRHRGGFVLPALRRASFLEHHDVDALHRQLDSLFANPIGARLGELRLPTLVISGEFDPLVPPAHSRRVADSIPGARFALVRRAGHNPMDERPREFERMLLDFLAETTNDQRPTTNDE
ncbi:MAG TPA: alpha/beta hydrolase [Roseiflexaceae bacterium]|nr:alpha/beta hydrolase [Roseiflexaceae bacterium]